MNKTGSKVVLLLLIIPLLLIFTTSTVVNITEIIVEVPVKEVKILGEKTLLIDIDGKNSLGEYDNAYKIETVIEPADATHGTVRFKTEPIDGKPEAEVIISEDGTVRPLSAGSVKIVATAGARSDSVQITYVSDSIYSLSAVKDVTVDEGEQTELDEYVAVEPSDTLYRADVKVVNPLKLSVDAASGAIKGLTRGETKVEISVDGIEIDRKTGLVTDKTHTVTLNAGINAVNTESGISFAGETSLLCATTDEYVTSFGYDASKFGKLSASDVGFSCDDPSGIRSVTITPDEGDVFVVTVKLSATAEDRKKYKISILIKGEKKGEITVINSIFATETLEILPGKGFYQVGSKNVVFSLNADNSDTNAFRVVFVSDAPEVVHIKHGAAEMRKEGKATITATIYDAKTGKEITDVQVEPKTIEVLDSYKSIFFTDRTGGLKNELAIGGLNYANGKVAENKHTFSLTGMLSSSKNNSAVNGKTEKIVWKSSDESVATVGGGVLTIVGSGTVTITASSAYNEKLELKNPVFASITINARKNGLNVSTYEQLIYASDNGKETVLTGNVMLAPRIADMEEGYREYLAGCTKEMQTTADYSYYKDTGHAADAKIRYAVEFTADVYGNGYEINGEYVTQSAKYNGYSVFKGPLDLVRLSYDNQSGQNASVKAQDNIVFVVKKDNVKIDNVELKGCRDESLKNAESGGIDLGLLDKCGTVLEIVGDNCSVSYSMINNGRTVVRIYGKAAEYDETALKSHPENYRIGASINNCVMENGREFIMKLGSNQFVKNPSYEGDVKAPSATDEAYAYAAPALKKADGTNYAVGDGNASDEYFMNNYCMTDVTVKDSVFLNAGLFSVGLESKFAGVCLHGYDYNDNWKFSELGWGNIAGTSYPAILRLEGDVRFYDWKDVSRIDSSTLIEGSEEVIKKVIDLNIGNMIAKYNENNTTENNMVVKYRGIDYVNGAIAYYGGGKNYGMVQTSGLKTSSGLSLALADYRVGMNYFNSTQVVYCAGKEPFRFKVYSEKTGISVEKQETAKQDGSIYDCVRAK